MKQKVLIFSVLIAGFVTPALADGFGQRFGYEPPFALRDTLDPTTVIYIEPSAGAEEEDQERTNERVRVYPSEGNTIEVRPATETQPAE